jgi:hypothetical protein
MTPHYEVERVRTSDVSEKDEKTASYNLVIKPELEVPPMSLYGQKDQQQPALKGIMSDQSLTPPPAHPKSKARGGIINAIKSLFTPAPTKPAEKRAESSDTKRPSSQTNFRHHNKQRGGRDQRGGRNNRKPGQRSNEFRKPGERRPPQHAANNGVNRESQAANAGTGTRPHEQHAQASTQTQDRSHEHERHNVPTASQHTHVSAEFHSSANDHHDTAPAQTVNSVERAPVAVGNDTVILLGPPTDHPQTTGTTTQMNQDRKPRYPSNQRRRKRFSKNSRHRRPQSAAANSPEAPRQAFEGEDTDTNVKKPTTEE